MSEKSKLIILWKERLGRFQERPEVALGIDANVVCLRYTVIPKIAKRNPAHF